MSLDRDAPAAHVVAHAPRKGVLEIEAKKSAPYHVRLPAWVPPDQVRVCINGKPAPMRWRRAYLVFPDVHAGDRLRVDYPLPRFSQRIAIGCERSEEFYDVQWTGNDIDTVSPSGRFLAILAGSRRPMPPLPDEGAWEDSG